MSKNGDSPKNGKGNLDFSKLETVNSDKLKTKGQKKRKGKKKK